MTFNPDDWPYEPVPVFCLRCGWEGIKASDHDNCPEAEDV